MSVNKQIKLSQPQQMMADERKMVEEAYAGDIIGIFDPGIFSIGDTLTTAKDKFQFEGIPTFAPEHFARVRLIDSIPPLYSWKIWMAPSCAICVTPFTNCLRFMESIRRTRAKCSGANVGKQTDQAFPTAADDGRRA